MSLAIEALRQVADAEQWPVGQVLLRDVNISTALVVPETDAGVEIVLRLDALADEQLGVDNTTPWYAFSVESLSDRKWVSHCRGKISSGPENPEKGQCDHPVDPSRLTQRVPSKRWYEAFRRVGFYYGPAFQQLGQVRTDRRYQQAEAEVRVRDHSDVVQDESRYVIHPATIDACLQLIIISIHHGKHKEMPWGVVPIHLEEVTLRFPSTGEEGSMGKAVAWTDRCEGRYFNTHTQLMGQNGRVLVDVKSLRCVAYEAAVPADAASKALDPAPFATVSWKPDVLRLVESSHPALWPKGTSETQVLVSIVQMIHHRHPLATVLLCGQHSPEVMETVSSALPKACNIRAAGPDDLENDEISSAAVAGSVDLVVVDETVSGKPEVVLGLARGSRWVIETRLDEKSPVNGVANETALYPVVEVPAVGDHKETRLVRLLARDHARLADGIHDEQLSIMILHDRSLTVDQHLVTYLSSKGHTVKSTTLGQFDLPENQENAVVIIDDRDGSLLSRLSDDSFESLKSLVRANLPMVWLTQGVRQGACVFGGMVQGFLRVIRSENASAMIVQLDVDEEEQPTDVAEALLGALWDAPTKDSGKDTEFWLHKGVMHIARVVPNHPLNREWASHTSPTSHSPDIKPLPDGVRLKPSVVDRQLTLTYDEAEASCSLGSDEIEIQILASELQSTPNTPAVVYGRVLRRGSSVPVDVAAGDQVIALTTETFTTVVRTASYIRYDSSAGSDMTTILAGVAALSKVVNMCITAATVSSSDRILALPGPKSTLYALVRLGQAMGWKVSLVTRSTEEQQEFSREFNIDSGSVLLTDEIRTHMREKNCRWVILAHEFSPLSQELWRQLPARSVFVLNDTLLETALDPLPFSRGALFVPTSVATLQPAAASGILEHALHLVQKYPNLASNVACVHEIGEFCQSNNVLREIPATKIGVATYRYRESLVRVSLQFVH